MNHPVDLLVDLVDGSIGDPDRAVVEAHLASCERCRHEVALATAGLDALRSLPAPAVPPGLGDAAISEAEERARGVAPEVSPLHRGGRAEAPAWYRWAGAAAAAAAVIFVVAIALPNLGGDDRAPTLEAGDATVSAPLTATALEVQDIDYDTASIQALALSFAADRIASEPEYAGASVPTHAAGGFDEALACLRQAQPSLEEQRPARLIAARYDGTPAYLGAFLAGPGADQPADTVTVWAVDRRTCSRILNTTTATL